MLDRERVEHAAKYGSHLVVDARELLRLINEIDELRNHV